MPRNRWLYVSATVILALLAAVAVLADVGDAWQMWTRFVDVVRPPAGAHHHASVYVVWGAFALVLLAILLALLARVAAAPSVAGASARDKRRRARDPKRAAEIRRIYLKWLKKDVENRLDFALHRMDAVHLASEETWDAVQPWYFTADDPRRGAMVFNRPEEAFEHYGQRLLLLGSPGSGKTTSLQQIALRLVDEALHDPGAPVPMLLNLSRFTASRHAGRRTGLGARILPNWDDNETDLRFERWLIETMLEVGGGELQRMPDLVVEWVLEGHVALLLDGLDEVADSQMAQLARLLNTGYLKRNSVAPVVICSRIIEYRELRGDPDAELRLNGAATLHPLTPEKIDEYLAHAGADALREAIPGDEVLYEMASNPLTLSIMRLAYSAMPKDVLSRHLSPIERRVELFDAYVTSMLQRRAYRRRGLPYGPDSHTNPLPITYSAEQVGRWLGWLAVRLSERGQTVLPFRRLYYFLIANEPRHSYWTVGFSVTLLVWMALAFMAGFTVMATAGSPAAAASWAVGCAVGTGLLMMLVQFNEGVRPEGPAGGGGRRDAEFMSLSLRMVTGATTAISLIGVFLSALGVLGLSLAPGGSLLAAMTIAVVALAFAAAALARRHVLSVIRDNARWVVAGTAVLALPLLVAWWWGQFDDRFWITLLACVVAVTTLAVSLAMNLPLGPGLTWFLVLVVLLPAISLVAGAAALATLLLAPLTPPVVALVLTLSLVFFVNDDKTIGVGLLAVLAGTTAAGLAGPRAVAPAGAAVILAILLLNGAKLTADVIGRVLDGSAVRLVLFVTRSAPLRYQCFLDHCADAVLLTKAGNAEYEFVHRMLRDHFAVRALTRALAGAGTDTQVQIVSRLALQGESAFETLRNLSVYPDRAIRRAAVAGLARLGLPACVPLLEAAQRDPDPFVRRVVPGSLARISEDDAYRLLALAACDSNPDVRLATLDGFTDRRLRSLDHKFRRAGGRAGPGHDRLGAILRVLLERDPEPPLIERIVAHCARNPQHLRLLRQDLAKHARSHREMSTSPNRDVRIVAAQLLGHVGDPESEQALLGLLADPSRIVREMAITALGEMRSIAAIPTLLDRLGSARQLMLHEHIRLLTRWFRPYRIPRPSPVVAALGAIGAIPAVPALLALTPRVSSGIRCHCLNALAWIGDPRALAVTVRSLEHPSTEVRVVARFALHNLKDPSTSAALANLLRSGNPSVAAAPEQTLEQMGAAALPVVVETRLEAAEQTLGQTGAAALPALAQTRLEAAADHPWLDDPDAGAPVFRSALIPLLRSNNPGVRSLAVDALGRSEDPAAIPILWQLLQETEHLPDTDSWRPEIESPYPVHKALLRLGVIGAVEPLVDRLIAGLADPSRRDFVCATLGVLADPGWNSPYFDLGRDPREDLPPGEDVVVQRLRAAEVMPALAEVLASRVWYARAMSAYLLGRIDDPSVLSRISPLMDDEDPDVRAAAKYAVARLDTCNRQAVTGRVDAEPPRTLDAGAGGQEPHDDKPGKLHRGPLTQPPPETATVVELIEALESPSAARRANAAVALGRRRAKEAVLPLLYGGQREHFAPVSEVFTSALREIGEEARDDLVAAARSGGVAVRCTALHALGTVGGPAAAQTLVEGLRGETNAIRVAAAEALAVLADPAGEPALREALNDYGVDVADGTRVCDVAAQALRAIAARRAPRTEALPEEG
jgi:HEAT repeat protein